MSGPVARIAAFSAAFVLFSAVSPADASVGQLTQLAAPDGCVFEQPPAVAQCADGRGVADTDAAISPDGKNVYTVSFNYDGNPARGTLAILDRDPDTGVLTQKPGAAG